MSKIEIKYNKEEPQSYDAYVYAYHIDETGKEYLGYHVGRFDETYQHSCENPEFIGDLANSKKVLFTLIDFGSKCDMINLEHKLLKKVDARNNPKYYNRSNGGGKGVISLFNTTDLYSKIHSNVFEIKKVKISELKKLKRLQVRVEDIKQHMKHIADRVNTDLGNTDQYLVHVLEDYEFDGQNLVLNGSHTIEGIAKSKHGKIAEVSVMFIPKKEWKKYTEPQLRTIANDLNPRNKYQTEPSKWEDWAKNLYEAKIENNNFEIRSQLVRDELKKPPRNFTSGEVTKAINLAVEMWDNFESNQSGQKLKIYSKDELHDLVKQYSNKTTIAFAASSGQYKDILDKLVVVMMKAVEQNKNVVILIYHNSHARRKKWNNILTKFLQNKIEFFEKQFKMSIDIEPLRAFESDIS